MRIVSLLASGTEMVCALGCGDELVGRSHECDNPEWVSSLPSCSEPAFDVSVSSGEIDAEVNRRIRSGEPLYRVDNARIAELKPDLIISQVHCEVCAVTPSDVKGEGCATVLALTAGSMQGIFDGIRSVAAAVGKAEAGTALIRREQQRLEAVRARTEGRARPTVAVLEWAEPLFAMGNWGPELVDLAGGDLVFGEKGSYSARISFEQLLAANPEYVIVAPCGFDLARSLGERAVLEREPQWRGLRAVRAGKVAFADGNRYFNRSGMTVSRTAEIIAEILHGVTFEESMKNTEWNWAGDAR